MKESEFPIWASYEEMVADLTDEDDTCLAIEHDNGTWTEIGYIEYDGDLSIDEPDGTVKLLGLAEFTQIARERGWLKT